jgi:hypothetical protein
MHNHIQLGQVALWSLKICGYIQSTCPVELKGTQEVAATKLSLTGRRGTCCASRLLCICAHYLGSDLPPLHLSGNMVACLETLTGLLGPNTSSLIASSMMN